MDSPYFRNLYLSRRGVKCVPADYNKSRTEMLRARHLFLTGLRPHLPTASHFMLTIFLIVTFLASPRGTHASELENLNVDRYNLDVLEGDVLTVYVYPVVRNVTFNSERSGIVLTISTNYTAQLRENTAIWVRPESQGTFNLTISFRSDKAFDYTVGVYSRNADFYGKNVKFSGDFGTFFTFTRPPGNWTINVLLSSYSPSRSIFHIELPTPVNAALFLATTGFIAYLNAFLMSDTYFKNKKESVSNKRWILVGIVIVISGFAIYQLYSYTTFSLSWSAP